MSTSYKKAPATPGVYLMRDLRDKILYIGKAGNLKRRVSSYFMRPQEARIERLLREVKKISYKKTDTALEALILESQLIKKHKPSYNVREKDDKSFLYVEITREKFPRVLLVRGKDIAPAAPWRDRSDRIYSATAEGEIFGPFTSASSIREALRILRKIFPYATHPEQGRPSIQLGATLSFGRIGRGVAPKPTRPCFDYQIGLCPGTCIGAITQPEYRKTIRNIRLFLQGKKKQIVKILQKEMKSESRALEFEKAEKIRRQIFALKHIEDTALIAEDRPPSLTSHISPLRIEGYDISNISGTSAVGSMAVFVNGEPDKNQYRKFKIYTIKQSDDVGMLKEVLRRRFRHTPPAGGWPLPDLILIDGGKGQVNAAKSVLSEFGFKIPIVGIAKGPKRKKNEFIGRILVEVSPRTLIRVRNEAHRFAVSYHRWLRRGKVML